MIQMFTPQLLRGDHPGAESSWERQFRMLFAATVFKQTPIELLSDIVKFIDNF